MIFKALKGLMAALLVITFASAARVSCAQARPLRLVALGDSLTAGYGVAAGDAFPVQLEKALKARGYDVTVLNAGVSGDTATQGLARLDWSVPPGTDAAIVALGANDMLRGLPPEVTRTALTQIITRLKGRGIPVLLAGMRAAPNLGQAYGARFEALYPEIAAQEGVLLEPFFLDGVAGQASLLQKDGLHPNPQGVAHMVAVILPLTQELLAQAKATREGLQGTTDGHTPQGAVAR